MPKIGKFGNLEFSAGFFDIVIVLGLLDFVFAAIMIVSHMLQDGGSHGIALVGYSSPTFWPRAAAGNALTIWASRNLEIWNPKRKEN